MRYPSFLYTYRLPTADPPVPFNIINNIGEILLVTDNCGIDFELKGNKYQAAELFLEKACKACSTFQSPSSGSYKLGPINFIYVDFKIVDAEAWQKGDKKYGVEAENREDVIDFANILKSMLKLKVFL